MAVIVAAPQGTARLGLLVRMVANETIKGLQVMWSHKGALVPQLFIMVAMYWAIQFFIGGGRIVEELVAQTLVGFWAYVIGYLALLRLAAGILEEMYTGTLEQTLLSPLRPWALSLGRLGAAIVEGAVTAMVASVLTVVILTVTIPLTWAAILPIVITLVDLAGFALFIGGLALVVRSIGSVIHVIQSLMVMVNGAFIPIYVFPTWLEIVAKIAPSTLGIDVTRRIMFSDQTLAGVWSDGSLPLALLHAGVMLLLGWTVFQAAIRRGLRDGRLGP